MTAEELTPEQLERRVVVCAANRLQVSGRIVAGARHWDSVMRGMVIGDAEAMPPEWIGAEQGFIDQYGIWMDRQEAWKLANERNQIRYPKSWDQHGTLYSEDLY